MAGAGSLSGYTEGGQQRRPETCEHHLRRLEAQARSTRGTKRWHLGSSRGQPSTCTPAQYSTSLTTTQSPSVQGTKPNNFLHLPFTCSAIRRRDSRHGGETHPPRLYGRIPRAPSVTRQARDATQPATRFPGPAASAPRPAEGRQPQGNHLADLSAAQSAGRKSNDEEKKVDCSKSEDNQLYTCIERDGR